MSQPMQAAHRMMRNAVARHIFPGAVLAVSMDRHLIFERAYGVADLFSDRPMRRDTCFDLASLTKPLATAVAVMALVSQGRLDLDQPCGDFCTLFMGSEKARITIRQLLGHSSGLPPWRPFFMQLRRLAFGERRAALQLLVRRTPLLAPPAKVTEYSDLGYMLLQWVVESITGTDLAAAVHTAVYAPLGIEDLFFTDVRVPVLRPGRFAATQFCPWRQKLMVGHVDDDNAYISGGIAGHAGLFGTAAGVIRLLRALLAAEHDQSQQAVFDTRLVRQFFTCRAKERWALGFDTPAQRGSSAGRCFPPDSVGHLGFTGTSFWVHRPKRVAVVLLTNRVHPWRFNTGIKAFRPALHDAVMESLT